MDPQNRPDATHQGTTHKEADDKEAGSIEVASIGVSDVDGEHEVQVRLLAAFVDAIAEGRAREERDEILDRLLDYSKLHFLSEELLMRFYSYSGYEAHVREHEQTVERIIALRERSLAGDAALSGADAAALSRAIVAHIREMDRALGRFLAEARSNQNV
jgi:hemerythrin